MKKNEEKDCKKLYKKIHVYFGSMEVSSENLKQENILLNISQNFHSSLKIVDDYGKIKEGLYST